MPQNLTHLAFRGKSPFLSNAFRLLDDINLRDAALIAEHSGGDAARLIEAGYGVLTPTAIRLLSPVPKFVKHGLIVLPCRDALGRIVALHDYQVRWITSPAPHIANPLRARWAEIQVCQTTSEADSLALSLNVCAIGRNGCPERMVTAAVLSALRSTAVQSERRIAA